MGVGESLGDLDDLAVGVVGAEVNGGTNRSRSHVMGGFDFSEENFLKGVRVGKEFVVIDFYKERNLVRVFAGHRTENAEGRADGVATAFDREFHDILGIEVGGVFGEAGSRRVFDALVHGQDRKVAGAGEAAAVIHPLEIVQNALVPVGLGENAIHEVGAGQVALVFGNSLRGVLEKVVGLVAES